MSQVDGGVLEAHVALHPEAVPVSSPKLQITRERWVSRREAPGESLFRIA